MFCFEFVEIVEILEIRERRWENKFPIVQRLAYSCSASAYIVSETLRASVRLVMHHALRSINAAALYKMLYVWNNSPSRPPSRVARYNEIINKKLDSLSRPVLRATISLSTRNWNPLIHRRAQQLAYQYHPVDSIKAQ